MSAVHTTIRIDKELHEKVVKKANKEMRSTTNAINFILKEYFEMEEAKNGKSNK